jgi:hypothetical protein
VYRFHRAGDEAPIRLFVRLVGENGERVMVRVGGGWSDLEAYLRTYAAHHGRRTISEARVEIEGVSVNSSGRATPISRPESSMSFSSTRNVSSPATPLSGRTAPPLPTSRPGEGESMLGLAGPRNRLVQMSPEDEAWVEGVKVQVRKVSAARRDELMRVNSNGSPSGSISTTPPSVGGKYEFEELGKVGATRRLFMKKSEH